MTRAVFATYGSAGDLFPILPAVQRLNARGIDTTVVTSRSLSLYLRAAGIPTASVGDGREVRAISDSGLLGLDRGGWGSWERLALNYLLPTLGPDTAAYEAILRDLKPDVVVATGFAIAARRASAAVGIPLIEVSIYPQHQDEGAAGAALTRLRKAAQDAGSPWWDDVDSSTIWGTGADVILHDRFLLGDVAPTLEPVGYPGWDQTSAASADQERLDHFLAADDGPVMLATLGSFLGATQRATWQAIIRAASRTDMRLVVVGLVEPEVEAQLDGDPRAIRVGFVPFDEYLPRADLVVHHGGLGTTFAAVRAGRPALVLPQAFDQAQNGDLVERAGLGCLTSAASIETDIERLLASAPIPDTGRLLVGQEVAAEQCADHIEERIGA